MRRVVRNTSIGALALVCMQLLAVPTRASSFGSPSLYIITGKIAPPYNSNFNLQTGVSSWPALLNPVHLTDSQAAANGELALVYEPDVFDTLVNVAHAFAKSNGIYGSAAEMADFVNVTSYVGLFSYSQIYQNFVKDSVGAYCNYHIGFLYPIDLYTRATFVDDVRAEFAIDISGTSHARQFSQFHQDAGVRSWAGPAGPTSHAHVTHGPMTYTDLMPSPMGYVERMVFDPYTGSLDLTSLNVGDTFTVMFQGMTQVAWQPGDDPRGFARIIDPAGTGAVDIEIAGVHAIDNAVNPILAVGDPTPRTTASFSAPHPNPARGAVSFVLDVPHEGHYAVDVFDLSGRHLARIANGPFSPGAHALNWIPGGARTGRIPSGVYFVRATGPGLNSVRRVVRVAD